MSPVTTTPQPRFDLSAGVWVIIVAILCLILAAMAVYVG